jgi:hypothetical protein
MSEEYDDVKEALALLEEEDENPNKKRKKAKNYENLDVEDLLYKDF